MLLGRKCFLDSDDLRDLRLLQQARPRPSTAPLPRLSLIASPPIPRGAAALCPRTPPLWQAVRESEVLLLVQSESVLTRPYCLLEMVTAIEARVPIVGVNLAGKPQAYDFANAANYLS